MISTLTILSPDQGNIYVPPWRHSVEPAAEPLNAGVSESRSGRWNLRKIATMILWKFAQGKTERPTQAGGEQLTGVATAAPVTSVSWGDFFAVQAAHANSPVPIPLPLPDAQTCSLGLPAILRVAAEGPCGLV